MREKPQWSLREMRRAYVEILRAYNALFPLDPDIGKGEEEPVPDFFDGDEESTYLRTMKALKKAHRSLKEAANESGSPQVWHRGQSSDGLSQGMRGRISKALEFWI